MQDNILTVVELTDQLKTCLEGRFPFVWVRGEVSNLSRPSSGHLYFSLKDQDAQMQCVWFLQQQRRSEGRSRFDPLTGEVLGDGCVSPLELLRNGLYVFCAGRIGIYPLRGQYQLLVDVLQPAGQGGLAQLFEERKRKLAANGYFTLEYKRPLPKNAQRIALITSPAGAAIHDFLRIAQDRGCGSHMRLFPALMQGEGAAADIIRAINDANAQGWAQVIVVIRGGGSLEDLWVFNEENVADAIFQSNLPVLAGIGHEVDVTLADMTADMRAATPSHAAQLLWPLRAELWQRLREQTALLHRTALARIDSTASRLREQTRALVWRSPLRQHMRLTEMLGDTSSRLVRAAGQWHENKQHAHGVLASVLEARNPLSLMTRGFALARTPEGDILRSVEKIQTGQNIEICLADGVLSAVVSAVRPIAERGRHV